MAKKPKSNPNPRPLEEIQKHFEQAAAHLGQLRYQTAILESQQQELMKRMLELNQEAAAAKEQK